MERVFFVKDGAEFKRPPQPARGEFNDRLQYILQFITSALTMRSTRLTVDEFVASCPQFKRQCYRNAADSLGGSEAHSRHAKMKSFVKAEKAEHLSKKDPVPRLIQPRRPEYCLSLGRFMRPIEHPIYDTLQRLWNSTTPVVFKGMNASECGVAMHTKWTEFSNPVALSYDATRFDQHVSVPALKWEHQVYTNLYGGDDKSLLSRLLQCQIRNVGVVNTSDGFQLKYVSTGCRMSGDMNTSLGNCLLMCAMFHSIVSRLGIRAQLANNGDDCVLIINESDLVRVKSAIPPLMLRFGFQLNLDCETRVFEQIDFCQTRPVFVNGAVRLVRHVENSICKDLISLSPIISAKHYDEWRNAVGLGGLSLTSGVPVMQSFYEMIRRGVRLTSRRKKVVQGVTNTGFDFLSQGMVSKSATITDCTRTSFFKAFGILPDHQIELEEAFGRTEPLSFGRRAIVGSLTPLLFQALQFNYLIPYANQA